MFLSESPRTTKLVHGTMLSPMHLLYRYLTVGESNPGFFLNAFGIPFVYNGITARTAAKIDLAELVEILPILLSPKAYEHHTPNDVLRINKVFYLEIPKTKDYKYLWYICPYDINPNRSTIGAEQLMRLSAKMYFLTRHSWLTMPKFDKTGLFFDRELVEHHVHIPPENEYTMKVPYTGEL